MARKRGNKSLWIMLVVIAILAAVILLLPSCVGEKDNSDSYLVVGVGDKAPDFTVDMVDSPSVTLSGLEGTVVLVNFFASWCPHCVESMKRVEEGVIERFKERKFVFLPISRGETKAEVEAYRKLNGYTFPMGLDVNSTIYDQYAQKYIPRHFLIDEDGEIVMTIRGNDDADFNKLIEKIELITQ